ncbi:hypothetical protein PR048_032563 [Dryococelus australis]|uniref:Ribosomal protein S3 n=1 Tax=Dryococelus australis TaxID=614101 RepID=A0ABQ9G3Q1_9NEOP|nr:hypothetical protein PR048_032563 [Dryococelus australis]
MWVKREPEKIRRQAASSGTIPPCKNPGATPPRIEPDSPWWEVVSLAALPPRPLTGVLNDTLNTSLTVYNWPLANNTTTCCTDITTLQHASRETGGELHYLAAARRRLKDLTQVRRAAFSVATHHASYGNFGSWSRDSTASGDLRRGLDKFPVERQAVTSRLFLRDICKSLPAHGISDDIASISSGRRQLSLLHKRFVPSKLLLIQQVQEFPPDSAVFITMLVYFEATNRSAAEKRSRSKLLMNFERETTAIGSRSKNETGGKREIPEKTRRLAASSGTIPTYISPVTRPGIEPGSSWWEASKLTAQPPRPQNEEQIFKRHVILLGQYQLGSPLVDDRPIMNAVKYRVVSGVAWTNGTMVNGWTGSRDRSGAQARYDQIAVGWKPRGADFLLSGREKADQELANQLHRLKMRQTDLAHRLKMRSGKVDTASRIKYAVATKHMALNWRAVFSSRADDVGRAFRLLASHQGEQGSITGFSLVGIMMDDAVGRRIYPGISPFSRSLNPGTPLCSPYYTLTGSQDLAHSDVGMKKKVFSSSGSTSQVYVHSNFSLPFIGRSLPPQCVTRGDQALRDSNPIQGARKVRLYSWERRSCEMAQQDGVMARPGRVPVTSRARLGSHVGEPVPRDLRRQITLTTSYRLKESCSLQVGSLAARKRTRPWHMMVCDQDTADSDPVTPTYSRKRRPTLYYGRGEEARIELGRTTAGRRYVGYGVTNPQLVIRSSTRGKRTTSFNYLQTLRYCRKTALRRPWQSHACALHLQPYKMTSLANKIADYRSPMNGAWQPLASQQFARQGTFGSMQQPIRERLRPTSKQPPSRASR